LSDEIQLIQYEDLNKALATMVKQNINYYAAKDENNDEKIKKLENE